MTMSDPAHVRMARLLHKTVGTMREEFKRTGTIPDHLFDQAEAVLDEMIVAMPLDDPRTAMEKAHNPHPEEVQYGKPQ